MPCHQGGSPPPHPSLRPPLGVLTCEEGLGPAENTASILFSPQREESWLPEEPRFPAVGGTKLLPSPDFCRFPPTSVFWVTGRARVSRRQLPPRGAPALLPTAGRISSRLRFPLAPGASRCSSPGAPKRTVSGYPGPEGPAPAIPLPPWNAPSPTDGALAKHLLPLGCASMPLPGALPSSTREDHGAQGSREIPGDGKADGRPSGR